MIYLFGVRFGIWYVLFWLVIVLVIGIRFWVGKIWIVVLFNGNVVCLLVIFLLIELGFGWRVILILLMFFDVMINFIFFFWKLGEIVINKYFFGDNFFIL